MFDRPQISTTDYFNAPSGVGPQAGQWSDKPHRLIYDLCKAYNALDSAFLMAELKVEELTAALEGVSGGVDLKHARETIMSHVAPGSELHTVCVALCSEVRRLREFEWAEGELADENESLRAFIASRGYRRCDIPACNCGSYHGGNSEDRMMEIAGALQDAGLYPNGNTLLAAVNTVIQSHHRLMDLCE